MQIYKVKNSEISRVMAVSQAAALLTKRFSPLIAVNGGQSHLYDNMDSSAWSILKSLEANTYKSIHPICSYPILCFSELEARIRRVCHGTRQIYTIGRCGGI